MYQGVEMNRTFFPVQKFLFTALWVVSSIVASGAEDKREAAKNADPAKGEILYTNGDATRSIPPCISCHGVGGNSAVIQNPKLAGQHEGYLYKQLRNFKAGDRDNPVMGVFAKGLTDEEMKNVSAYLSAQSREPGTTKNMDFAKLGMTIYRGGIADIHVPACAGCHGPNGAGIPSQFPRIGGQHQDYTAAQLTGFRSATRKNSPQMAAIAMYLSDDQIRGLADYIAGLK